MKKKNKDKKNSLYFIFNLDFTSGTHYKIIKAYVEVVKKFELSLFLKGKR